MTSKKQILKTYFETNCSDMYKVEFENYKQAVEESEVYYFTSFYYWLDHHAKHYNILKDAIEAAGYQYPQSDRTIITASHAYSEVGCNIMQHA